MRKVFLGIFLIALFVKPSIVYAQIDILSLDFLIEDFPDFTENQTISSEQIAGAATNDTNRIEDVTKTEGGNEKAFALFSNRPIETLSPTNSMAFGVQYAVKSGVPANTVLFILLLPLLATIVAFFRHVVGLPSMGLLVPIALSITFLATGITTGLVLLATIIFATIIARLVLKQVRIMQLPKIALSIFVVAIFVLAILTISASLDLLTVKQISIFPILLLIILSERIIALQLERRLKETLEIVAITLCLGIFGLVILSSEILRVIILLYPEVMLLLIPLNIIIGRYFGLRITEYFRFKEIIHGNH